MSTIPIILMTNLSSLRQKTRERNKRSGVEVAIPVHRGDPFAGFQHKMMTRYMATPFEFMSDDKALKEVRRVLDEELLNRMLRAPLNERWGVWQYIDKKIIGGRTSSAWKVFKLRGSYTGRQLWSLMLIDWVFRVQPERYLAGKQSLADAFAEYIGLTKDSLRWGNHSVFVSSVIWHRATIRPDHKIVLAMKQREREMFEDLVKISGFYKRFGKLNLMLAGLLTGVTEVWIFTVLLEALFGYLGFLADMWEFEEDGIITEQEVEDLQKSFVFGIVLPLFAMLQGIIALLAVALMVGVALFELLSAIVTAIIELCERLAHALAALEAGMDEFAEVDPEKMVYIPYPR